MALPLFFWPVLLAAALGDDAVEKPELKANRLTLDAQVTDQYLLTTPVVRYRAARNATRLNNWSELLGLKLAEVDEPLQRHLGLKENEGVLVLEVEEQGTGSKADLKPYDVILRLPAKAEAKPLELITIRLGQRLKVKVDAVKPKRFWIGVQTEDLTDALRAQLSLASGRGILISEVIEKSPAERAGLLRYDVVVGLADGSAIGSTADFSKLIQVSNGKTQSLQVIRHAKSLTLGVTPTERPAEEQPQASAQDQADQAAMGLELLIDRRGDAVVNALKGDQLQRWAMIQQANPPATQDPAGKVAALQTQVDQLLKEVKALRLSLEKQPAQEPKETKKK